MQTFEEEGTKIEQPGYAELILEANTITRIYWQVKKWVRAHAMVFKHVVNSSNEEQMVCG